MNERQHHLPVEVSLSLAPAMACTHCGTKEGVTSLAFFINGGPNHNIHSYCTTCAIEVSTAIIQAFDITMFDIARVIHDGPSDLLVSEHTGEDYEPGWGVQAT